MQIGVGEDKGFSKMQCNSSKKIGISRACLLQEGSVSLCTDQQTLSLMGCGFRELGRFLLAQGYHGRLHRFGCLGCGHWGDCKCTHKLLLSFECQAELCPWELGGLWCQCEAQHHHCVPSHCSINTEEMSFSACRCFMGKCCQIFVAIY